MNKSRQKNVTWSPVIVPVNKPSRVKTQDAHVEKSYIHFMNHASGLDRHVSGYLTAKSRGDTHSLLLTIRNNSHRDMQFLIDLPNQTIRRIYDGQHSWDVHRDGSAFSVKCDLGQIDWKGDEIRDPSARGFRLDWLNGDLNLTARRCEGKSYRGSTHSKRQRHRNQTRQRSRNIKQARKPSHKTKRVRQRSCSTKEARQRSRNSKPARRRSRNTIRAHQRSHLPKSFKNNTSRQTRAKRR
jgi:hypothetical protein